jgi:parvulin-like peptidyl-prolyl isomerase
MSIRAAFSTSILTLLFVGCSGETDTPEEQNKGNETEASTKSSGNDSPAAAPSEEDVGTVLATVGDIQIGSKEWQMIAARKTPADGQALTTEEKEQVLNDLIEQKLLYLHARSKGVDRDPKVQKLMVQTLMRNEVYSTVRNSDFKAEELQAYFEEHREDFVVPEKVQVRRIHVKVGDKRSADEAKALLESLRGQVVKNPEKFKTIARDNSEDPYRKRGGDLGFVAKEGKPGVPTEVTDKAFAMKVGDLSEVFEGGGGYNLITVVNRRERVERTYEQMKASVLRKMKAERFRTLYKNYVTNIRGDYSVDQKNALLEDMEVKAPRRFSMGNGPGGLPKMPVPALKKSE